MPTSSRTASRWSSLVSLCASLPGILELPRLLQMAVERTAELFDAQYCAVFLRRDGGLDPAAQAGPPSAPLPEMPIQSERDLRPYVEQVMSPAEVRRFAVAPMVAGGEVQGQLVIASVQEGRPHSRVDLEMLGLLAHHIATAVQDSRILERAGARQQALARIAAALAGEVELKRIAQTAADLAVGEMGADGAAVWVARPEERLLEMLASVGLSPEVVGVLARLSFEAPAITAVAAATRQTQVVESLEQVPERLVTTRRTFEAAGLQSIVAAPLMARGELMGVLGFASKTPHRWSAVEMSLVKTLADLLASAIYNAQLYRESERRRLLAEAVIDNSPVAIVVHVGPEHRYLLVNPAYQRITGTAAERVLGRTFAEMRQDMVGGPVMEALEKVYRKGETTVITEFSHDFGPPAGVKHLSLLYAPLKGPDGQVEGVIVLMLDITERVAARRRLEELAGSLRAANQQLVEANLRSTEMAELARRRAAELEATIANMADAVFVCDPQGRILLINSAGLQTVGVQEPSELRTLTDYLTAARPRFTNGKPVAVQDMAISRALRGEVVRGMEEILYDARLQRDRYILVSAAPVRDDKGRSLGAVEVQSDITSLKELDLLKDQFITVAAHEIKTPVTAIKGFAQALLRVPDGCQPRYRKALETIVQQSDRIAALVRDFLEVSRIRWGRVEISLSRIDLTNLVSEVVDRMAVASPGHKLLISRKDAARVEGDPERLQEVMENLLDNATKFSPPGSEVEVQVLRQDNRVVVSVKDQGVGIPRRKQPHLFERFYRAHIGTPFDYGGLGVGLYISREIVQRHGGQMWFESEEGRGSTFYFSLPLASNE